MCCGFACPQHSLGPVLKECCVPVHLHTMLWVQRSQTAVLLVTDVHSKAHKFCNEVRNAALYHHTQCTGQRL